MWSQQTAVELLLSIAKCPDVLDESCLKSVHVMTWLQLFCDYEEACYQLSSP